MFMDIYIYYVRVRSTYVYRISLLSKVRPDRGTSLDATAAAAMGDLWGEGSFNYY